MTKKKRLQMQRRPGSAGQSTFNKERNDHYQELVQKYRPGTPAEAAIDPAGSEDEWEARLFHGWLNGRDIPIAELCVLFNRDEATIRRWLAMGK